MCEEVMPLNYERLMKIVCVDALMINFLRVGREAEDEYDHEDPAERRSQNGVCESAAKNE